MPKTGSKCPRWSKEEIDWLKINYPNLGSEKSTNMLNVIFGTGRTREAVNYKAKSLKIRINQDVWIANRLEKVCKPIGSLRKNHGKWLIKDESGNYIPYGRSLFKDLPEDYTVIYLDNNPDNLSPDNFMPIPRKYLGLMAAYHLRSEDPRITETAVKWCELYSLVKDSELDNML